MKIAILGLRAIGTTSSGGVEKAVEELSTRFVAAGNEVTVFCRARYASAAGHSFRGVRIRPLPAIYTKHLEAISNTVVAVLQSLRGYDVVHINATGPALLAFIPRLFGRAVVVTVHGLDWKREKWGIFARLMLKLGARAAVSFPQRTIVCSKTLKQHYRERYGRAVEYIPNGVTVPGAGAPGMTGPPGFERGSYFLFLSRLVPEKGCHTLIEAFRGLETDRKLVIVGGHSHSGQYAEKLRQLAAGDSRIVFAGPLYGEAKDAAYRNAYAFVLPSTIEGMAIVLLEAMSYGKCCLCSDIDENLEVIDPAFGGEAAAAEAVGDRFRTGDAADLRDKLAFLDQNPERVTALGERARSYVAERFDWDAIASRYLEVFRESAG